MTKDWFGFNSFKLQEWISSKTLQCTQFYIFQKKKCIEAICLQGPWGSTLYSLSYLREKKKKSPWHQRPDNRFGKTELYSKVEVLLKINNNQTRDASYKYPKAPGRCLRAADQPWSYQVHVMSNTCIINRKSLDQLGEIRDSATKEIWVRWHLLRQSGFYVMHFLIPRTFLSKLFHKYLECFTPCI